MRGPTVVDRIEPFRSELRAAFPYFEPTIDKRIADFGEPWVREFNEELDRAFGDDRKALAGAVRGYCRFALDAMRLQKRYERTRRYDAKSYADAAAQVYRNPDYMRSLYLPGILLSHYMWPHHHRQLHFFRDEFIPRIAGAQPARFYDVGVGTGFYSKELLVRCPLLYGRGYDISPYAREHALALVGAWGAQERYEVVLQDIVAQPVERTSPVVISVEVLEHLEDPQPFLNALARMLDPGGSAFVTAALTAPNADHIYLYVSRDEIRAQLARAGLKSVSEFEEAGYEPTYDTEPVPRVAAFVVQHVD